MSRHSFDPEIAKTVGVNAAVIYQNITWWCEKNAANKKNIQDGKVWTYNSINAFLALFPYLTVSQIKTALSKLEDSGFIESGNFNKTAYDRTKWYAVKSPHHLLEIANGVAANRQPIPDNKPDNKQTPIPPEGDLGFFQESLKPSKQEIDFEKEFSEFWEAYPKKAGKPAAKKAFAKAITRAPAQIIIERAKALAALHKSPLAKGEFRSNLKHPQGWLNDDRWNDQELRQSTGLSPERQRLQAIIARNQGSQQ